MANAFKNQYIADGVNKDFVFSFEIPLNRSVLVYVTPKGQTADEEKNVVAFPQYVVILNSPDSPVSAGKVRFNKAPAKDSIVTVTPDQETKITYLFSNTVPFNTDNLNGSFSQEAITAAYNLQNYLANSIRYNVNENNGDINYDNKVPPLREGDFWRRKGSEIIAQDFNKFIAEIGQLILKFSIDYIDSNADNTNLGAAIASNDKGQKYSGNPKRVDPTTSKVITDPKIEGYSAKAGALWAQDWAQSGDIIVDDYGNKGRSAKYYADTAGVIATSSTGVIDQLRVFSESKGTKRIDLVNYKTKTPWENVLSNSLSIYVDGDRLQEPTVYSPDGTPPTKTTTYTVVIRDNPTLSDPSFVLFDQEVPQGKDILLTRGEAQGDGATMFRRFNNALPLSEGDLNTPESKAPLWASKGVQAGGAATADWTGGFSVVTTDTKDSAAMQLQVAHELDNTPSLYIRSNVTKGEVDLKPANFTAWYEGVTMKSDKSIKQPIRRINFDTLTNKHDGVRGSNIQAYHEVYQGGPLNIIDAVIDSAGANNAVTFKVQRGKAAGDPVAIFQAESNSDATGEGVARVYGEYYSGPKGDSLLPNLGAFPDLKQTTGFKVIAGQGAFAMAWSTREIPPRAISPVYRWPLSFKEVLYVTVAQIRTNLEPINVLSDVPIKYSNTEFQVANDSHQKLIVCVTCGGFL